jgi:hypothetical protein
MFAAYTDRRPAFPFPPSTPVGCRIRRRDRRRRRAARRARVVEHRTVEHEHFDRDEALRRWRQRLATMTARGFMVPIFGVLLVA